MIGAHLNRGNVLRSLNRGAEALTAYANALALGASAAIHTVRGTLRLEMGLVAEIGAAFLCAELQITQETRPDHAQYLAQWLTLLKRDSKAIFSAAAKASEAASYLKRLGAQMQHAA